MNSNSLTVTGSPTLVAGALTLDTDQALSFSGPTSYAQAVDSTSLSITNSLSLEFFVKLTSYPGSTQTLVGKAGSYVVQITNAGILQFVLTGPSVTTTLSANSALSTGTWHHVVCVFNNNYAGTPRFGKSSNGSIQVQVDDDNGNPNGVTRASMVEQGLLSAVSVSLQYVDEVWPVQMCGVVYADSGGLPGALVTRSDIRLLDAPTPQWNSPTWITFPVEPVVVPAGTYHIGYVADTQAGSLGKSVLTAGAEATGGFTSYRKDSPSSPSSPFGAPVIITENVLAAYCDYTPTSRSGLEGKALIYINGALNVSTLRTDTITDTANALQVSPNMAAQIDEVSIWNKPLTGVQIATHYTAH